jgi:hypothetical protein
MHDEFQMCPFTRSIAGLRGTVLLRRHESHAIQCAQAIRRRQHPSWSSQRVEFRVHPASCVCKACTPEAAA